MEYLNKSFIYLNELVCKIKKHPYVGTIYSYTGNMLLFAYAFIKSNYPIVVCKVNTGFMYVLKWFIQKKMNGDYSKNKYVKYIYERFNNNQEYIEYVEYNPVIKMETKIVDSEQTITHKLDHKNNMDTSIKSQFNNGFHYDCNSLVVFHKLINGIQYHRIFTPSLWKKWKQTQNTIYSVSNDKNDSITMVTHPESFYITNTFEEIKVVSPPFIFVELNYESTEMEWVTIVLYENIKRICVNGNIINHDSLQYICMKYHQLNLEDVNYKLNVLFPKTESITEYTRDRLNTEPIVI